MFDNIKIKTLRTHQENKTFGHGYPCKYARKGFKEGWSWLTERVGFK